LDVILDCKEAFVNVKNAEVKPVVTCFLRHKDKILILKRSDKVRTSKGKWAGVSGYVETGERPEETAFKEIREETGIKSPRLIRSGEPVYVKGGDILYQIHPFLFEVDTENIKIDWEHVEYRWIRLEEMDKYDTVPRLQETLKMVLI